jgi:hypothetical protein
MSNPHANELSLRSSPSPTVKASTVSTDFSSLLPPGEGPGMRAGFLCDNALASRSLARDETNDQPHTGGAVSAVNGFCLGARAIYPCMDPMRGGREAVSVSGNGDVGVARVVYSRDAHRADGLGRSRGRRWCSMRRRSRGARPVHDVAAKPNAIATGPSRRSGASSGATS